MKTLRDLPHLEDKEIDQNDKLATYGMSAVYQFFLYMIRLALIIFRSSLKSLSFRLAAMCICML